MSDFQWPRLIKQTVIAKAGWGQSHQLGKETAQRPNPGPLSHPELVVLAMETNGFGVLQFQLVGGFNHLEKY